MATAKGLQKGKGREVHSTYARVYSMISYMFKDIKDAANSSAWFGQVADSWIEVQYALWYIASL